MWMRGIQSQVLIAHVASTLPIKAYPQPHPGKLLNIAGLPFFWDPAAVLCPQEPAPS